MLNPCVTGVHSLASIQECWIQYNAIMYNTVLNTGATPSSHTSDMFE